MTELLVPFVDIFKIRTFSMNDKEDVKIFYGLK
jgi:hypothetical protein